MVNFEGAILMLESWGISDVILPFILIFTLVFAVLQQIKLFEKKDTNENTANNENFMKKFHSIIALAMALGVVIPHVTNSYPSSSLDVVNIINKALPNVSIILVAVVGALIILGTFGVSFKPGDKSPIASLIWVGSLGAILYIFGSAAGWGWSIPNWLGFLQDPDTQALLIIIIVFGAIIYFITKPERTPEDKKNKRNEFKQFIKDMYE